MYFNSNTYKLIPETKKINFLFRDINLLNTGVMEIGISGNEKVGFGFRNNRIFDKNNKFVGIYDENQTVSISGFLNTGNLSYFINNDEIIGKLNVSDNNYSKFYLNITGEANVNVYLWTNHVPYSVNIPTEFFALSGITGQITNSSDNDNFYIYDIFTQTFNREYDQFSGDATGLVNANSTKQFALLDTNSSLFDEQIDFLLGFNTTLGLITGEYSVARLSGLSPVKTTLANNSDNISTSLLFDGSGTNINKYNYVNSPASNLFTYEIFANNLKGESKNKTIDLSFEAVSPLSGQYYESNYVTGFTLSSSGEYLYPPIAQFTGYYYVTGMSYDLNSILLSSGCSGNVAVIFTGSSSKGSGVLSTRKIYLQNVYDAGINSYYVPTSFNMVTGGTGYFVSPLGVLQTGAYANCYDVPSKNGYNHLIYRPFNGYGSIDYHAGYLTGIVLTTTGLVNGGSQTGYLITGIDITNAGFGYNTSAFPKVSFLRSGLDGLTKNATGDFSIKQSGYYDFTGHWSIKTGISNESLSVMPLPSGTISLSSGQNYITIQVNLSGKDHTQPLVGKLSVTSSTGQIVYNLVSGIREYNNTTGFLKKKNISELTRISADNDLTFLLSQDELDNYYSSNEYITDDSISLGDLDF